MTLARKLRQQHDEIDRIEPKGEAKHRAEILEWIKQNPEWRSEAAELTRVRPGLEKVTEAAQALKGAESYPTAFEAKTAVLGQTQGS